MPKPRTSRCTALGQWARQSGIAALFRRFSVTCLPNRQWTRAEPVCINGGARGRHASGFVGPAVALVALLHAAGDHIKRELGELIEIHLDGAQRRCGVRAGRGAVEADDSHIVGHADAVVGKASDYSECGIVVNAEDAIDGRGASRCPRGARGTDSAVSSADCARASSIASAMA